MFMIFLSISVNHELLKSCHVKQVMSGINKANKFRLFLPSYAWARSLNGTVKILFLPYLSSALTSEILHSLSSPRFRFLVHCVQAYFNTLFMK